MQLFNLTEEEIPKKLYRYVPWNDFTKDTIANHHIYLSDVEKFNDKYEFRINPVHMVDEYDNDQNVKFGFTGEDQDITEDFLQRGKAINNSQEESTDIERKCTRVACLTNNNNNTMMWYFYANKYRGVCLEWINLFKDVPHSSDMFGKVEYGSYDDALAKINKHIPLILLGKCQIPLSAPNTWVRYFFKSPNWSCENEYRLIRPYIGAPSLDDFFDFDSQRLTGIYCGLDMSKDDKQEVYELAKDVHENITVYEAKYNRDGFGFIFEPYKVQR